MSRIKTHSRSTRITELDRIPSRVYAISWVDWQSNVSRWALFLTHVKSVCRLYIPELLRRQYRYEALHVFGDFVYSCD